MKVTVVVATHKKYRMPKERCYLPLQVGKAGKEGIGYTGDDTGDNISDKNPNYCELTGLYWLWKNVKADYVGLVHYRRYFTRKSRLQRLLSRDKLQCIIKETDIITLMKRTEIIVPKKRQYVIESMYSHYAHTHYREHLDITRSIIERRCPEYLNSFDRVMKRTGAHMFNMFIMTQKKCDEYCGWLFPILAELERHIDIDAYNSYQARLYGRVSEMMLDVWLDKNKYSFTEIPVINLERQNWVRKIPSFAAAKILGRKYSQSF